jgi:hypothetical protein
VVNNAIHQSHEQDPHLCCLVFAAGKKVLGAMRAEWVTVKTQGYEVRECDRDITRETPVKIQKLLARHELTSAMLKPGRQVRHI